MSTTNTITILDSLKAELEIAKAEYERKPDFDKLKEITWMENKVAQYTARAEKSAS